MGCIHSTGVGFLENAETPRSNLYNLETNNIL